MPVIGGKTGSTAGPQQHKQPSRKGRKAWRKNVDVSEVEQGLEERNDQIIKGGLVKEQESEQLFAVEDTGDADVAKKVAKKYRGLKADEILAQRSAVPAVAARKRKGDGKTTDGVLEPKRVRKDFVSYKELVRLRQLADGHHESTVEVGDASFDPWAVTEADTSTTLANAERSFSFLPKPQAVKPPPTLKHAPISLAANGKPIPALAKPKADLSYNPSFEAYETRLTEEGVKAVEAERKRLADEEAERIRMEAVARSAAEADAAAEREMLSEWEEDSAWEGFQSGAENEDAVATGKRPKRKTPAQRNRINRRKEAEAKKKHEAQEARKKEQIKHLQTLLEQDKFEHEKALARAAAGDNSSDNSDEEEEEEEEGDDSVLRRRQLGKYHLPEKNLELVLPDELQGSLRLLKPEGNLLQDRYRSMLVRGKVEARKKRPFRKQRKVKVTEKWAHKDFQLF